MSMNSEKKPEHWCNGGAGVYIFLKVKKDYKNTIALSKSVPCIMCWWQSNHHCLAGLQKKNGFNKYIIFALAQLAKNQTA